MSMSEKQTISRRVEISGWDVRGTFFVEKTVFHWLEDGTRRARLHASLSPGDMIFVRAMDNFSADPCAPVAYLIESISLPDQDGLHELTVDEFTPRESREESVRFSAEEIVPDGEAHLLPT
jgi:hypothetical protein